MELTVAPPDVERRAELLDGVVAYLAEHGLADLSLRPVAKALDVSLSGLVHHFGTKDELLVEALRRAVEIQTEVRDRWLAKQPSVVAGRPTSQWWRWINAAPANAALVRLGIEAAALDATRSGLPGDVRAEQIGLWRSRTSRSNWWSRVLPARSRRPKHRSPRRCSPGW